MKKLLSFLLMSWLMIGFTSAQQDCEHAIDLTPGTQQCGTNDYLEEDGYGTFPDASTTSSDVYNSCNYRYNDGEYWFKYVGNGTQLKLDVSQLSDTYSGLFVFDDCPMDGNCIAGKATSSDDDYSVTTPPLSTGHTYYIVIANYGSPDYTDFCLDATEIEVTNTLECDDVFYDTGGDGSDFGNDEDYWVKICAPSTKLIELDFSQWEVDDGNDDYMVIYDGDGVSSGNLAYGDEDMPITTVVMSDTNSTHCLLVHWVSDGSNTDAGWIADVKCFCACQNINAVLASSTVTPDADGNMDICGEKEITLTAGGDYTENDQCYHQRDESSTFVWDFGDGTYKDTGRVITRTFPADSGATIDIIVIDSVGCESHNVVTYKVRSSIPPTFNGTKPGDDEICLGTCTRLIPETQKYDWEVTLPPSNADTVLLPDGAGNYYYSDIRFTHFKHDAVLTDASQLDSIMINIEHSYIGDLLVWIVCPNGTEVLLFDGNDQDSGLDTYLGIPGDDDGNEDIIGDGWRYTFRDASGVPEFEAAGTVDVDTKNGDHTDHESVIPGLYSPAGNFSDLIGCPLNGTWSIKTEDDQGSDNGYLFDWYLWMEDSLYRAIWGYEMAVDDSTWSGPADLNHPDDGTQSEACPTTLGEKNYIYTVTDNFGCEYDTTIKITVTGIEFDLTPTMVSCNGKNDGEAKATVTSGDVKEYKWTYADGTTGNIETTDNSKTWTDLKPGTFTVTIVNTTGCETVHSVTITEPDELSASETHTNLDCHDDADGSITLTVSGGTESYTYDWDNDGTGDFNDSKDLSSLSGGDYKVTIKDAHGCELALAKITITEPDALTFSETHTNLNCHGDASGAIDITNGGGTSPYTYSWVGPDSYTSTNGDISSLAAGDYKLTIKDDNDCELKPATITITEPDTLQVTQTVTNLSCNGDASGAIDLDVSGGVSAYTFSWENGGSYASSDEDISNLEAETYAVTVEDAHHCEYVISGIDVTEPTAIDMSIVSTTHSDCGAKGGTADLDVSGGTPAYTYSWSDLNGGSSSDEDLTDVAAGNYRLVVTDINGCEDSLDVSITDNGAPTSSLSDTTHNKCYGETNGNVKVVVSGGTAPYKYDWDNDGTGDNDDSDELSNLPAGTYNVVVTDDANCKTSQSFTVKQPTELKAALVSVDSVKCHGEATGKITISVTQGTPTYHYSWAGPDGYTSTDPNITDAKVGTYAVTVTDDSTCTVSIANIEVKEPTALSIAYSIDSVKCHGEKTGSINVTVTGGVKSYTYKWYGDESTTSEDLLNVGKGTYNFLVTDIHSCKDSVKALKVEEPDALQITYTVDSVKCHGEATGNINLQVTGGVKDYYYDWDNDGFDDDDSLLLVEKGSYTLQLKDHNGCLKDTIISVEEPTAFANSVTTDNANCGANDGKITITASGSNGDYTYAWYSPEGVRFDSSATSVNDTLRSGSYMIVVIDKKECKDTLRPTITENGAGTVAALLESKITCHSYSNASVKAVMTGGAYDYTYSWILGSDTVYKKVSAVSEEMASSLKAGTYKVVVVDANGCQSETSITITEPDTLESSFSKKDLICFNDKKGEASVTNITGGTNPYSVKWYDSKGNLVATDADAKELPAGTYSFLVTDSNNCSYGGSVNLKEPSELVLVSEAKNKASGGDLFTEVSGGTPPYTYEWSNGKEDSVLLDQIAGKYVVTVTDAHGCTQKDTLVIEVPLVIPTIISPNGDGKNDTWRILGIEAYSDIHIEIYNRWGNIVFEYTGSGADYGDAMNRFNGFSTDGKELPLGSYVYILDLVNENRNYSGVVTVIKEKQ